jgi:WD40 repeat protein/serine/threonine protein kinase
VSDTSAISDRERRFNLILADFLEARRRGVAPTRDELVARHPEFAAELDSFLADHAALERVAPPDHPAEPETVSLGRAANAPTAAYGEAPSVGTSVRYFGDYELLQEVARGGMGVVYKARQVSLNRVVALKMILAGQLASETDKARFKAEATAAGQLDHPNIVPIYEVGEHAGMHYFSMKLVEGGSLARWVGEFRSTIDDFQNQAARLLVQVARGVHYAHQRGTLHRDLKPANILLSRDESRATSDEKVSGPSLVTRDSSLVTPLVTDFGLAKQVEGGSEITGSGSILGTPSYMAPEQASGSKGLTIAVDVYALGAILYECLTGRPPFRGESAVVTLHKVLTEEPDRPRSLDPSADPDLETIALKCLEKEPARRYESAAAFADDLQRWLDGLPIEARPVTSTERAWKWAKRRPAVAGLIGAVAMSLMIGTSVSAGFAVDASAEADRARTAARHAEEAKVEADRRADAERDARAKESLALARETEARKEERDARKAAEAAQKLEADARAKESIARQQAVAEKNAKDKEYVRADGLRLAAEADAARFRDPGLALLLATEGARRAPNHLTFNALYAALAECREERTFFGQSRGWGDRGWHVYEGDTVYARYLPGARRVLAAAGNSLRVWEVDTGKVVGEWKGYNLKITGVALSPDAARAAVTTRGYAPVRHADGTVYNYTDRVVYVVDLATGADVVRLRGSQQTQETAEFDGGGKRIVTTSWDGFARVYDAATGKMLREIKTGEHAPLTARFTPDGKQVLTVTTNVSKGSFGYDAEVWGEGNKKTPTDPEIDPEARPLGPSGHGSGSMSGLDSTSTVAELWDAETGKSVARFGKARPGLFTFGHVWYPKAAALSADGKLVAVAFPGVAGLWDAETGKSRFDLQGHQGDVLAVAFRPGARQLATAGADKTVRLWNLADGREVLRLRGHTGAVTGFRFSADGKRLVTWSDDRTARVWDAESGAELVVLRGHTGAIQDADFRPDGLRVLTAGDNSVRVWNLEPPRMPDLNLQGHAGKVTAIAYSPDGKFFLTASADQSARLWESATGKLVREFGDGRPLGEVRSARFSPDGKRVVTAAANRAATAGNKSVQSAVIVWDVDSGRELLSFEDMPTGATAAEFTPDGKRVLTVGDGYVRRRYNSRPEDPKRPEQKIDLGGVSFSVSTGGTTNSGIQHLWDAATGKLVATLFKGKEGGWTLAGERDTFAFTPDASHMLTVDKSSQTPTLYRTADGKAVRTFQAVSQSWGVVATGLSPDGRTVLVSKSDNLALFDAETGMLLSTFKEFPGSARDFTYSADGTVLAVAAHKSVFVFAMPDRKLTATLKGHLAEVTTVAVSPDGSRVLTGAADDTAAVWDAADGRLLSMCKGHTGKLTSVLFRADGRQAATLADDGTARLWPVDLWPAVAARTPRGLTEEEYDRFEVTRPKDKEAKFARQQDRTPRSDPPPGTPLPERFAPPPAPPAEVVRARQAELAELQALAEKPADVDGLRAKLHDFRRRDPATVEAAAAAGLLAKLRSPLDTLDQERIPQSERPRSAPKELVAVVGETRQRHVTSLDRAAVSASGKVVATRDSGDGTRFWDADTLDSRGAASGRLLGFARDRDEAFTAGDGVVITWDVSGPEPKKVKDLTLPAAERMLAITPDGRFAAGLGAEWNNLRLWDLSQGTAPGRLLHKTKSGYNEYNAAAISPDGRYVAVRTQEKRLLVFDTRDEAGKPHDLPCGGHRDDLAFSPDGTRLAAGEGDAIQVWDFSATPPKELARLVKAKESVRALAFTPDGKSVYASYYWRDGCVWDLTATPPQEARKIPVPLAQADALALSPDGRRVYAGIGIAVRGFDVTPDGWRERRPLAGHTAGIGDVGFAADGRTLYSADDAEGLRAWALSDGAFVERRAASGFGERFLLSPDERTLIGSKFSFSLWDAAELRKRTKNFDHHSHGPVRQSLSADGRWLARASWNPALSLYDLGGPEPREHAVLKEIGDSRSVRSVAISPDGAFVAAAFDQQRDGEPVLLWRVDEKGLRPVAFPYLTGAHVQFAPDGRTLAVADRSTVSLIDLGQSAPAERLKLKLEERGWGGNLRVIFSPDASRLVTMSGQTVTLWDAADGRKIAGWSLPHAASLALAPDGRHLAVGNTNGTVWVLRLP